MMVVCALVLLGAPARASLPGPSTTTYAPAATISVAQLRAMKHNGWDARNVAWRPTKISRAQAIAIVGGSDVSQVTEAALTRVTTYGSAASRLMWAVITVKRIRSIGDPMSLGGPLNVGPDPRTVTKVDPLTGDVVLPPALRRPEPVRTWTIRTVMLVDPDTGEEPYGMSL